MMRHMITNDFIKSVTVNKLGKSHLEILRKPCLDSSVCTSTQTFRFGDHNVNSMLASFSKCHSRNILLAKSLETSYIYSSKRFFAEHKARDTFENIRNHVHFHEKYASASRGKIRKDACQSKETSRIKVEDVQRENVWTIPNFLCISRIVMTPILCGMVLDGSHVMAVGIFTLAGFTDLIDGLIARKFPSQASRVGSFLDPLADKILLASLYLTLTYTNAIPALLTAGIVARDVLLVMGASYIRYKSLPPPKTLKRYFDPSHATVQLAPTFISKVNTSIQIGLIVLTLAAPVFSFQDHYLLEALWYITGASTILSGCSYIYSKDTYKILSKIKEET